MITEMSPLDEISLQVLSKTMTMSLSTQNCLILLISSTNSYLCLNEKLEMEKALLHFTHPQILKRHNKVLQQSHLNTEY